MGSSSKRQMSAQKRAREQRLRERRAAKEERKAARKLNAQNPDADAQDTADEVDTGEPAAGTETD
jgi:hypothetical protein